MSTLPEIEAAAEALPAEDKAKLLKFVTELVYRVSLSDIPTGRHPGLHEGAWDVAKDFDAPLPDDFWMGAQQ